MKKSSIVLILIMVSVPFYSQMISTIQKDEKVPISLSDCNRVIIQATVCLNGTEISGFFAIDTGAPGFYMTPGGLHELLPADIYERDIGDRQYTMFTVSARYELQSLVVGKSIFEKVTVRVHDASEYVTVAGRKKLLLGIIGLDIIMQSSFYISFENNFFCWTDNYQSSENSIRIPQNNTYGIFQNTFYPGTVTDLPYLAVHQNNSFLDTGYPGYLDFAGSSINILNEINDTYYLPKNSRYIQKIGATTITGELEFGGITFKGIPVTTGVVLSSPKVLIGVELLRHFNVYYQMGERVVVFLDRIELTEGIPEPVVYKKTPGNMIFTILNGFSIDSDSVVRILYMDNYGEQVASGLSEGDKLIELVDVGNNQFKFVFERMDGSLFEFIK